MNLSNSTIGVTEEEFDEFVWIIGLELIRCDLYDYDTVYVKIAVY